MDEGTPELRKCREIFKAFSRLCLHSWVGPGDVFVGQNHARARFVRKRLYVVI